MPLQSMGPPPRSFAADAHHCIMGMGLWPTEYKDVARTVVAPHAGSPQIVIPDHSKSAVEAVKDTWDV
jgi:hypothetical protein